MTIACRALLISAIASGQGKTTVTAALARQARRQGLRVRVFKTGPDFLDPMVLERASGAPVYQLALWMCGEANCRALLAEAAAESDLILIEGVMGLFDGAPSSADLAQTFGIPILAVIDASAMAQTFGAVASGLAGYRERLPFHGVLANRIGSARHAQMLAQSLPSDLHFLGHLPRDPSISLPDRHLGLLQATEIDDLDARIDAAADALGATDFKTCKIISFDAEIAEPVAPLLRGVRIAIARDTALAFLYPANLALLAQMGAELRFFSVLNDAALPEADAVYLPGGYPELHAAQLAGNRALFDCLRQHHAAGKPMLAECGGMMLLFEHLIDLKGQRHPMAGLLAGETAMQPRLQALGLQAVDFPDGELRGHTFHQSRLSTELTPQFQARCANGSASAERVFQQARLTASYLHFYFPSNSRAAANLFLP